MTLATVGPEVRNEFNEFGNLVAELLKLGALLVFGLFTNPFEFANLPVGAFVFAVLVLVGVRTVAVGGSLLGAGLTRSELAVAAWFGPKGFASAVYGLLVLSSGIPLGPTIFHIVVLVITVSIVAHSTTDHLVAEWFGRQRRREREADESDREQGPDQAGGQEQPGPSVR